MTKIDDVIYHLEKGRQLTTLSCQKLCGTTELRSIVSKLKRKGYQILCGWEVKTVGKVRLRYKIYWLR